ncbi:MAG: hypothetical protein OXU86_01875 [Thaumarchaeota archaeon]|nr:hypothetical protein [Nitrososphaerota archaeon]
MAITSSWRSTTGAITVATLVAIVCATAYAAAPDTVPPTFTSVPSCLIEAIASTASPTTVECTRPTATEFLTLTVEPPSTLASGLHTLVWKHGTATTDTATSVLVPVGTHIAKWIATDSAGNISTTTQVIVVQDTKPPVLALSKGVRTFIEATSENTRLEDSATAAGVSSDPGTSITTIPETLPVPETPRYETVTWRAEDSVGNVSTVDTRILVRDTEDPEITCGRASTVEPTTQNTVLAGLAAQVGTSAEDHNRVDPSPALTTEPPTLQPGARAETILWTATDKSGNDDTCSQRIWIRDSMGPTIDSTTPSSVTIETATTPVAITAEAASVTATDHNNVDPNPTITPNKASLQAGTHKVTWIARDSSNNPSDPKTQDITVAKFEVTSLAFNNNGIDITFSRPVDASTTGGILINKWYLSRGLYLGTDGMISTISTTSQTKNVVRVEPDLRQVTSYGFCTPVRANPDRCMAGSLTGPWLLSLPSTLTSAQGTKLYEGTAPTLKSCAVFVTSHPYWLDNRGVANTPGCVGYVNNPYFPSSYTGPAYSIWSDPASPSGSSSQGAQASRFPLQLSASLQAGTDSVMLDWMRGSLPTATYAVERSTDGGAFAAAQVTVLNATRATAPITPADLGSSLSYRMVETAGGVTARFDPVTVTLPPSLEAPSGLSAARSESGTSVALEWRDAPIASGYYVEKAGAGGTFERVATVTESSHTVELGAAAAGIHEFRVVAYLGSASSPPSATASVTLPSS